MSIRATKRVLSDTKRFISVLFLALYTIVATANDAKTRIAFISDAHVMDVVGHPELVRSQESQVQSTRLFNENYFALCAALDDCGKRGIKLVVLPGDLTDNGQLVNQSCVRDILNRYSAQYGMNYFVTMGNHDPARPLYYEDALNTFLAEDGSRHIISSKPLNEVTSILKFPIDNIKEKVTIDPLMHSAGYEEQTACYADFGYFPQQSYRYWATPFSTYTADNYSYDKAKSESAMCDRRYILTDTIKAYDASYVVEPTDGIWILSLDGNVYLPKGVKNGEMQYLGSELGYNNVLQYRRHLISWVEKIVKEAKQRGKVLITFCHYPIVDFNDGAGPFIAQSMGTSKFDMKRSPNDDITEAMMHTGLQLHFAGHMHVNDTGVKTSADGKSLINIQVPSPSLYVPAYKILTVNDADHFDVETIILDDVPGFDSLFPRYRVEYEHDMALGKQPIWSIETLNAKSYREFCDWHFRDLARNRFIPRDMPKALVEAINDKNGLEILRSIKSDAIGEEAMKCWTGFDMMLDMFRLRYASELALSDIPASRLRQYDLIFAAAKDWQARNGASRGTVMPQMTNSNNVNAEVIGHITALGGMFHCFINEEPCHNFSIDLTSNTPIKPLQSINSIEKTSSFVDPTIGSEGLGRTFPGPSMPFGMCKPGPDCTEKPNAGWAKMPEVVSGFSQTHVSGTGGGQKYGNILIQPFLGDLTATKHDQLRKSEDISLGYYATEYENGIKTEITTSERCAYYHFTAPEALSLSIDCGHYLGMNAMVDTRESQQFVGSEIEIISDREIRGYTRIRGGWNDGEAYTVYFCLQSDKPFASTRTWLGDDIKDALSQPDMGKKTGALVQFADNDVNLKVGISFVSTLKARANIPSNDFKTQHSTLLNEWEKYLSRIEINGTEKQKRMFYTGIYHTMLMPVDRSGENPKWVETPYYDDYYAIWDTYRTSSPLLTLLCPDKERDIVNSLLNIYKREGYMPDARSGNCNGRTQGGSNAEVVIADAYVKGLDGIDYNLALEAMLKDADVAPGGNEEREGRGGIAEYKTLGYIPYGIDRAGNRTIEYAYDDYCIALVAQGLGRTDVAERFMRQSQNWKNLWRSDFEYDGMRGFIMPRSADGEWLNDVPWGKSAVFTPTIPYTPTTKVAPWYIPWWGTFFYEATSEEYSLSIPHDVDGLIAACGGKEQFKKRLDLFFEKGYYNVANEPSFMTPCLYHWIGRPDLSSARIHQIINDCYDDIPDGLPGNDDSGAMSSWLVFHMLGLYPNAGQNQYIVNAPLITDYTIHLSNGCDLHVIADAETNDKPFITHEDIMRGGTWHLQSPSKVTVAPTPHVLKAVVKPNVKKAVLERLGTPKHTLHFTLNRQFRSWSFAYTKDGKDLVVRCKEAYYYIPMDAVENATGFCWDSPQKDGATYRTNGTFGFISRSALATLQREGKFVYDGITWRKTASDDHSITVQADIDRTTMRISTTDELPIVLEMNDNPLGITWRTEAIRK